MTIEAKMAEKLEISRRSVQRAIEVLKENGILGRVGGTRGYWKILK